jgi:hypothetical protein
MNCIVNEEIDIVKIFTNKISAYPQADICTGLAQLESDSVTWLDSEL